MMHTRPGNTSIPGRQQSADAKRFGQFDEFIDAEGFTAPSGIDIVGRQEAIDCIAFAHEPSADGVAQRRLEHFFDPEEMKTMSIVY